MQVDTLEAPVAPAVGILQLSGERQRLAVQLRCPIIVTEMPQHVGKHRAKVDARVVAAGGLRGKIVISLLRVQLWLSRVDVTRRSACTATI